MKDPHDCTHPTFQAHVAVNRFEDTGRFMADIRISCVECGTPFRFPGLPCGVRWDMPAVSIDEEEMHAPIEPAA